MELWSRDAVPTNPDKSIVMRGPGNCFRLLIGLSNGSIRQALSAATRKVTNAYIRFKPIAYKRKCDIVIG